MSNTLLTSGIILNDLLVRFQNNCAFARTVDTQYKDQFGKPNTVYGKIGESLKVRKPVKYLARTGNSMSTQATTEEYVTINCSTMKGVDFSFTDEELTMSVDEFGERYLESAAVTLASAVDADGLALALNVANSVGVPGTSPGDGTASTDPFADAAGVGTLLKTGALLSEFTAPLSERYVAVSPYTQATLNMMLPS